MLRLRRPFAVAVPSLLLLFGLTEISLRLVRPDGVTAPLDDDGLWPFLERHPILGWRNRARYVEGEVAIDERHLRRVDARLPDLPRRRVLCMGDSRTFGVWLDLGRFRYDNDYPRYLAARFAAEGRDEDVEVLNAGVVGYSSAQGLRWVRTGLLAHLRPDVVVAAFGVNDHARAWDPALRTPDPASALGRSLLVHASSWRLVQLSFAAMRRVPPLHPPPESVPWVEPTSYAVNLRRLARETRRRDAELLLLDIGLRPLELGANLPAFPGAQDDGYELLGASTLEDLHRLHSSYREVLRRVALEEAVPVIDGAEALAASARSGVAVFGPYDLVHPSVEGAKLLAETVYRALEVHTGEP